MKRALVAACLCAAGLSAGVATPAGAETPAQRASAQLQRAVTVEAIREHQRALQDIADRSGGDRFAGRIGYDRSAQYVYDTLRRAGYKPRFQEFEYLGFFEDGDTVLQRVSPNPATLDADVMEFSGAGDVTGALARPAGAPTGCDAADWAGYEAGTVALINRGGCTFRIKVANAAAAGASAAIIANNTDGPLNGTLGSEEGQATIPAVGTSQATGQELAAQLAAGPVTVRVAVVAHVENLTTRNVIAETSGNPNNVVMAGAHLDSVAGGPGIEDNGSGSAALLEAAKQMKAVGGRNMVRFAWWSAEESGLVGSTKYVEGLSERDASRIALYLNFDMIASPNFARFIYDGDDTLGGGEDPGPDGSAAIEQLFERYFDGRGLAHEPTAFDGRSDYGPFIEVGIPAGGLFTGAEGIKTAEQAMLYGGTAGVAFDPCYHQACDDFFNNSEQVLDENADAMAHAIGTYTYDTSSVNGQPGFGKAKAKQPARRGDAFQR
jgi:Zn-dependent M28 family amino/carboxypeptidase